MARRWPDGVAICPTCGRIRFPLLFRVGLWQCRTRHPKAQFSIKVGTIFEDSPIALDKWLLAMWMLANCKNGVSAATKSSRDRDQPEVCLVHASAHPACLAGRLGGKLYGEIEVDETYIGGKARNMHKSAKARRGIAGPDGQARQS